MNTQDMGVRISSFVGLCLIVAFIGCLYDEITNRAINYPFSCSGPLEWYTWIFLSVLSFVLILCVLFCVLNIIYPSDLKKAMEQIKKEK